jgi:hypothetical protein
MKACYSYLICDLQHFIEFPYLLLTDNSYFQLHKNDTNGICDYQVLLKQIQCFEEMSIFLK